ncbi:hypothetical protein T4D_6308 [Trichinella pseudospiralis]|uniref:Uncharacterized protein n=1 Tax=Trichinella pseudospiralis TaxID=6337 RepID=A0A0V1FRY7_TRIPS|nr:hypothetical protein T4D_6308 [Trichinella pseudospiralis]
MFIEFVPIVEYLHGFVLSNSSKDNDCIDKVLRKRTFTTSSMIIQCQHLSTPRLMFTLTEKISTFPSVKPYIVLRKRSPTIVQMKIHSQFTAVPSICHLCYREKLSAFQIVYENCLCFHGHRCSTVYLKLETV